MMEFSIFQRSLKFREIRKKIPDQAVSIAKDFVIVVCVLNKTTTLKFKNGLD